MEDKMLKKICSGGQTGADLGGLIVAKMFGIETGGWMPKGFMTQHGPKPEWAKKYNLQEHESPKYPPRTFCNIENSDGTIRLAYDLLSAGEKCTLKGIQKYDKPYIDVDMNEPRDIQEVVDWINENNIETLNVAGNSERTRPGMSIGVVDYMSKVFEKLGFQRKDG